MTLQLGLKAHFPNYCYSFVVVLAVASDESDPGPDSLSFPIAAHNTPPIGPLSDWPSVQTLGTPLHIAVPESPFPPSTSEPSHSTLPSIVYCVHPHFQFPLSSPRHPIVVPISSSHSSSLPSSLPSGTFLD